MAEYKPTVLTRKGINLITKVQSGTGNIEFTRIKTGSGIYRDDEDLEQVTDVKVFRQAFGISGKKIINSSTLDLTVIISNVDLTTGYYIGEIGLYANDPDEGEILYSITASVEDKMDYLPPDNNLAPINITVDILSSVTSAETVVIDGGVFAYASAADLSALEQRVKALEEKAGV